MYAMYAPVLGVEALSAADTAMLSFYVRAARTPSTQQRAGWCWAKVRFAETTLAKAVPPE